MTKSLSARRPCLWNVHRRHRAQLRPLRQPRYATRAATRASSGGTSSSDRAARFLNDRATRQSLGWLVPTRTTSPLDAGFPLASWRVTVKVG
jgi:hypothetical protein